MFDDVLVSKSEAPVAALPVAEAGQDFRRLLRDTLIERCRSNPRYSLRAFARSLKLEPSFLSKILSGKRRVTPKLVRKLALALGLSPREAQAYLNVGDNSASPFVFTDLYVDAFEAIADWHHYAILELVQTDGFREDARWVAARIGASVAVVQAAIDRLLRLKMLERGSDGKILRAVGNYTNATSDFTSVAFRKLQRQILRQAIIALDDIPIELRDQTSMTMGIDPDLLPEASDRISEFRRSLCTWLQAEGQPRKEVYQLSISLFPVTHSKS